ncbi:putative oxidoreductase DltE [Echria macrotheca]|uniref:Oxidoreductase DltE n=1 Tax=Echria macrotheca TaxID=438768 RepID=A0AAJ0FCQ3_9PEZI|nr:putative oxidoreductase DltE [Echria macrotheca]
MPFPYKTVLITGATSGIGAALAERMIAADIFVVAVGRRADRLEALVSKHGADRVAAEAFDVADLDGMGEWAKRITATYPALDAIVLNAGFQRTLDFTRPAAVSLPLVTSELQTNYLSPVHMITHFLPHLVSIAPRPAAIVLVSSGLAVIPFPRCAGYCASKAALHSLAWTLRAQLASPFSEGTHHIRVVELIPPAVQTELHPQQPDLVAEGMDKAGIPLETYIDETWADLVGDEVRDEIVNSAHRDRLAPSEDLRRKGFDMFVAVMRKMGVKI